MPSLHLLHQLLTTQITNLLSTRHLDAKDVPEGNKPRLHLSSHHRLHPSFHFNLHLSLHPSLHLSSNQPTRTQKRQPTVKTTAPDSLSEFELASNISSNNNLRRQTRALLGCHRRHPEWSSIQPLLLSLSHYSFSLSLSTASFLILNSNSPIPN